MKNWLAFSTIIFSLIILVSCEEESDDFDCEDCSFSISNAYVYYQKGNCSIYSHYRKKLYESNDTIIDTLELSEKQISFYLSYNDSLIRYESVVHAIPFYLSFNSAYATPASIINYFAEDQIDSLRINLLTYQGNRLIDSKPYHNKFDSFSSNINSIPFSSIDSLLLHADRLSTEPQGNFIHSLGCLLQTDSLPKNRTIRFESLTFINEYITIKDTSQAIYIP